MNPKAIIAEINNTPWGEQHAYVLDEAHNEGRDTKKCYSPDKAFHISPFMCMEQHYTWHFTSPKQHLSMHMQSYEHGTAIFDATMNLQRTEISRSALRTRPNAVSLYYRTRYQCDLLAGAAPVAEARSLLSPSFAEQRKPMSQTTAPTLHSSAKPQPTSLPNAWARRMVLAKMSRFTKGHLTISDGEQVF